MADKTHKCVNCEKEFKSGSWLGCQDNPTRKHVVEKRTFYSIHDRYQLNAIPESRMVGSQGQLIVVPGIICQFFGGLYDSTDPEVIEVLERDCTMTKEQYMEARMTPEMKQARLRQTVTEQKDLIAQLQAENEALKKTPKKTATA